LKVYCCVHNSPSWPRSSQFTPAHTDISLSHPNITFPSTPRSPPFSSIQVSRSLSWKIFLLSLKTHHTAQPLVSPSLLDYTMHPINSAMPSILALSIVSLLNAWNTHWPVNGQITPQLSATFPVAFSRVLLNRRNRLARGGGRGYMPELWHRTLAIRCMIFPTTSSGPHSDEINIFSRLEDI
jgi:hypothetical protein